MRCRRSRSAVRCTTRSSSANDLVADILPPPECGIEANATTEAEATGRVKLFTWILWGICGVVPLVVGVGIGEVARGVVRPIVKMTGVMESVAAGELDRDIPSLGRRDEVGAMPKRCGFSKKMPCAFGESRPSRRSRHARPRNR